jgi:hypothetical protein
MREDIARQICERQRIGSRNKSAKTARKLNPNLDYDSLDHDWGPTYLSSSRRRQYGYEAKSLNENLNPLFGFLDKSVGRPWDDVYSEICQRINPTKAIDFHVLQHVGWHVELHGKKTYGYGLSVDENGILCDPNKYMKNGIEQTVKRRYQRRSEPKTSVHWYGNFWFKQEVLHRPAICGCVHFKFKIRDGKWDYKTGKWAEKPEFKYGPWTTYHDKEATCIHGNKSQEQKIWFVVEYEYIDPDGIAKVYTYEDCEAYDRARFFLKAPGDKHIVYNRDLPVGLPKELNRKTANRKELKIMKELIGAGQKPAS